jgi:hypothetical protein
MKPYSGASVLYKLTQYDADAINQRRGDAAAYSKMHRLSTDAGHPGRTGFIAHAGNGVTEGDVFPAVIVREWNEASGTVNLQVLLDGNDTYWATSRAPGAEPGEWQWPPCHCEDDGKPIEGQLAFAPLMASNEAVAVHWEEDGYVEFYPGNVAIFNALADDTSVWVEKLSELTGVTAVRLDNEHIAIQVS